MKTIQKLLKEYLTRFPLHMDKMKKVELQKNAWKVVCVCF